MYSRRALVARIGLALAIVTLCVSCIEGSLLTSRAAGEPAPQLLHPASDPNDLLASCGGHNFPLATLDAVAPDQVGPEFDALRQVLARHANELEGHLAGQVWRIVVRTDAQLVFLADTENGLLYLALRRQADEWAFANAGDCQLHAVLGDGTGAARWWLDPRRPLPVADTATLEILIEEQACASGDFATGRILPPIVRYEVDTITITVGIREVGGTCPSNPATPAVLMLAEPLGDRELLDGFYIPPAPARAPD